MNAEELIKELQTLPDEMTSSERYVAYARGEEVDHIPFIIRETAVLLLLYMVIQLNNIVRISRYIARLWMNFIMNSEIPFPQVRTWD